MAMEEKAREKQVNVQVVRLNKAIDALLETSNSLETSLSAVLSPVTIAEDKEKEKEPRKTLCEHAEFLRSKADDISKISFDLGSIIKRLEI